MPGAHARLSPSAAERWLACPASIRMEGQVTRQAEESSPYAEEGTCAHELGEIKARLAFEMITPAEYEKRIKRWRQKFSHVLDISDEDEMNEHTDAYVDLLCERMEIYPSSQIMLEQRLDTGVPFCWGTADSVIVSPVHVEIVDLKYGKGVEVEAVENPQLRLYCLGALDTYGDLLGETEVVRMTVHQPRLHHTLTEELSADDLRAWRTKILPIADTALNDPDAPFGPSDEACRWCPASGRCRAQLEAVFATDFEESPDLLEPGDMAEKLGQIKMVRDWLNAFEEAALSMAYSEGRQIPGWKVVLSGGQRRIADPEAAAEVLSGLGYTAEDYTSSKVKGIGDLEKLLGRDTFKSALWDAGIVTKSEGRPSLVPESDKRPSVNPNDEASKDFGKDLL